VIRLVVRRRVARTDPEAGFGLVRVKPARSVVPRRLSDFDAALVARRTRNKP